jgi:protein-S-isoprenylcysteine O-methyltransferase Ste14
MTNKTKLLLAAATKAIAGCVIMGLLTFAPAGTLSYHGAWLLLGILFIPMTVMGIIMFIKSPELLRRRLASKEKRSTQQGVIKLSGLIFVAGFIIAGLDYRWGWSDVPQWVVYGSALLFLVGYALYGEVMRENVWLSRTVRVEEEQEVVTTGLYGIVRHPMYAVTIWLFLSIPMVLGSWWALVCFSPYVAVIVVRILNEEKVLEAGLQGYADYKKRVKYRLFPLIW